MLKVYIWDPAPYGLPKNYKEAKNTYESLLKNNELRSTDKLNQFAENIAAWLKTDPHISHIMKDTFFFMIKGILQKPIEILEKYLGQDDTTEILRKIVQFAQACGLVVAYNQFAVDVKPVVTSVDKS